MLFFLLLSPGSTPVGLSLFFDFLLPLSSTSLGEFLARHMHEHHVKPTARESDPIILDKARKALWENLHGYTGMTANTRPEIEPD